MLLFLNIPMAIDVHIRLKLITFVRKKLSIDDFKNFKKKISRKRGKKEMEKSFTNP